MSNYFATFQSCRTARLFLCLKRICCFPRFDVGQDFIWRRWLTRIAFCAVFCLTVVGAKADFLNLGILSFDTFIPANNNSPGINAFNVANFTGPFSLPPDFASVDDLTFQGASLTLFQSGSPPQLVTLGDVNPGFLSDISGDPPVQVPGDQLFTKAEFTATLSGVKVLLADGNFFIVDSSSIDVILSPSNGAGTLSAGNDQSIITVSGSVNTPEPSSVFLLYPALVCFAIRARQKHLL